MLPTKFREIVSKAANRKNVDADLLNSIGTFIFSQVKEQIPKKQKLSIYIEGFGIWFHRKRRLIDDRRKITNILNSPESSFDYYIYKDMTKEQLEYELSQIDSLLQIYDEYVYEKNDNRRKRREERKNNENIFQK